MPTYRRPSNLTEATPTELAVTTATREDWRTVERWIEQQGWDPGVSDADQFHAVDPAGFFVGRLGDEIVSAIAVVNYDDFFAYLGHYMVHPDQRGQGYGMSTWTAAIGHAGDRTIGLESGDEHLAKYRKSGFADAYRTRHYAGRVIPAGMPTGVVPAVDCDPMGIATYDAQTFPADRPAFVLGWIGAPGHRAYVRQVDGQLTGYGVIRSAVSGYRIGPLAADSAEDAKALFDALTVGVGAAEISLEAPLSNTVAASLAESYGLSPVYETARMYNGPVRRVAHDRNFAIASFELG